MNKKNRAPVTYVLVAINIIVFVLLSFKGNMEDAGHLAENGAMVMPTMLESKEYYRLFTCLFLHFGATHLLSNMFSLLVLGTNLEPLIGSVKMLIIYFVSGLGGNLLSTYLERNSFGIIVSAGASGAIFGLTGALLVLTILGRGRAGDISLRGMLVMVALSVYMGFAESGIDNAAHIGGLVVGFILTLILCWENNRYRCTDTWSRG